MRLIASPPTHGLNITKIKNRILKNKNKLKTLESIRYFCRMSTQIKGIIFDLDGTLADTQTDLADSMNGVLQQNNLPTHPYDAYKLFVGKGLKMLVTNALPEHLRKDSIINPMLETLIEDYRENCLNKTELYPRIAELLEVLSTRKIPLVVFTNKDHDLAVIVCEALLSPYNFTTVLGRTNSLPRKPHPAGALLLAEQMNIPPAKTLYIGDTDNDMICANRAGMPSVGVLWGFRTEKELRDNGATFIVNEPLEIITLLK